MKLFIKDNVKIKEPINNMLSSYSNALETVRISIAKTLSNYDSCLGSQGYTQCSHDVQIINVDKILYPRNIIKLQNITKSMSCESVHNLNINTCQCYSSSPIWENLQNF